MSPQDKKILKNKFFTSHFYLFTIAIFTILFFIPFFAKAAGIDHCEPALTSPPYHELGNPAGTSYPDHGVRIFEYGACKDDIGCRLECVTADPIEFESGGKCVDTCGTSLDDAIECPYCYREVVPSSTDRHYCCVINSTATPGPLFQCITADGTVSAVSDATAATTDASSAKLGELKCCCYKPGTPEESCRSVRGSCEEEGMVEVADYTKCYVKVELQVPIGKLKIAKTIGEYIGALYVWLTGMIGVLAVVMIMVGGVQWMFAAGNVSKIGEAKRRISNAILAIIFAAGSFLILQTINPELLTLSLTAPRRIEPVYQETKAGTIYTSEGDIVTPGDPKITLDYSNVNPGLPSGVTDLKTTYQLIANEENIPWQVLAAIHYRECNNNSNRSLLNGGTFCNNANGTRCSACDNGATLENDMRCAARLFKEKANKSSIAEDDYDIIKDAFWGYNGRAYGSADASPYVANNFDSNHMNLRIQVHDCVPMSCRDCTNPPSRGCCTIQKGRQNCELGHSSRCLQKIGGIDYYVYQPIEYTSSNCGTYRAETRDGAMKVYMNLVNTGA